MGNDEWRVRDLRAAVEIQTGIPEEGFKLLYCEKELTPPGRPLCNRSLYDLSDGGEVTLVHLESKKHEDRQEALELVQQDGFLIATLDKIHQDDQGIALAAVWQNPHALELVTPALRKDREVVFAAVKGDGGEKSFVHAAEELKADRTFVLAAVQLNKFVLEYAREEFQEDIEIALAAVLQDKFEEVTSPLSSDHFRELVLDAVQQDGGMLRFVSRAFAKDREIVFAAVKQSGRALKYAPDAFKADQEIVLTAVKQNGHALPFAAGSLRSNREFMLEAVKSNGTAVQFASEDAFRVDREIAIAAIEQDKNALLHYPDPSDSFHREINLWAVEQDGLTLEFVSPEFKDDRKLAFAACRQNGLALKFTSKKLRKAQKLIAAAVQQNELALEHAILKGNGLDEELRAQPLPYQLLLTAVAGTWKHQMSGKRLGTIAGDTLFLPSGDAVGLSVMDALEGTLVMDYGGQRYTASFQEGQLHWNDGDVWERVGADEGDDDSDVDTEEEDEEEEEDDEEEHVDVAKNCMFALAPDGACIKMERVAQEPASGTPTSGSGGYCVPKTPV